MKRPASLPSRSYFLMMLLLLVPLLLLATSFVESVAAANAISSKIAKYKLDPQFLAPTLSQFKNLVVPSRNYALVVLLTASDNSGVDCGSPCRLAIEMFKKVKYSNDVFMKSSKGKEYHKNGDNLLHFVVIDLLQSKDVLMHLQVQHVPQVYFYPITTGPYTDPKPTLRGFSSIHEGVESLVRFINSPRQENVRFELSIPIDYYAIARKILVAVVVLGFLAIVYPIVIKGGIFVRIFAASISFATVVVLNGGYTWVLLRTPPYASSQNPKSIKDYVMGGMQQQNGSEVPLTAIATSIGSLAIVVLCLGLPKVKHCEMRLILVGVCMSLFVLSVSALAYMMSAKTHYPFRIFI